ncbi:MAG TPA: hypothetical protein VGA00_02975 [Acidiferrobacterales bacterium]|jgi:cytochrome c5
MMRAARLLLAAGALAWAMPAAASHDWGGIDVCSAYRSSAPPGIDPASLPQPESRGAHLLTHYCTQCHQLPGPGRHTAAEWPAVLERMLTLMDVSQRFRGLMGHVRAPSAAEREALHDYLMRHALIALSAAPREPQASSFAARCATCHALPDPRLHGTAEWPAVVARMQRHATVMQRGHMPEHEIATIVDYLGAASVPTVRILGDPHGAARHIAVPPVTTAVEAGGAGRLLHLTPFFAVAALGILRWGRWRRRERRAGGGGGSS